MGLTNVHRGALRIFDDVQQWVVKVKAWNIEGKCGFMHFKGSHALSNFKV